MCDQQNSPVGRTYNCSKLNSIENKVVWFVKHRHHTRTAQEKISCNCIIEMSKLKSHHKPRCLISNYVFCGMFIVLNILISYYKCLKTMNQYLSQLPSYNKIWKLSSVGIINNAN